MKILLIDKFHQLFGGAERAYFDTADTLEEFGHEVAFFSMQHPDNEKTYWSKYFVSQIDLRKEDYSLWDKIKITLRIFWNREAQVKLNQLLDEFQPDLVHLHLIYHQLSPAIIWTLKKRKIPMVMTLHDFKHISPNYNMLVRGKIWEKSAWHCIKDKCVKNSVLKSLICTVEHYLHKWLGTFKKVDVFIAPSKFLARKSKERGFKEKIEYVPQPLKESFFNSCGENKVNLNPEQMADYVLYIGRLSQEKGLDILIKAFAKSKAEKLVLVGAGSEEHELKTLVKKLKLNKKVFFAGYQRGKHLRSWICYARVTVLPSTCYENMPYVLLESLAAGVIAIVANLGGAPERIKDGKNGFLFSPNNVGELSDKINLVYSNKNKYEAMRKTAKASVMDLHKKQYYHNLMKVYKLAKEKANKR